MCLGLAFLLVVSAAGAQQPAGTIAAVRVTGSARFTSDQGAAMTGLKPGESVTKDDIQAAADRLAQFGPFQNVRFRFQGRGADVEIEFQVEDAPALPVSFDNFPWFTDEELAAVLQRALPFFDGTAPEQGAMLAEMQAALEALLKARGIAATVEYSPLGRPDGAGMMMQFRATGASLRVGAVKFSDAVASEDRRVRERLDDVVGKAYSRFAIEMFLNEQVRPVYFERGHLRVAFGRPQSKFTGDPNKPLGDTVLVEVPVDPGPAYAWAGAKWSGNTAFGEAALEVALGLRRGELANGVRLQAGLDRLRDEYGQRGFLDVDVAATPQFNDAAKSVTYAIAIREGPQYRMGEMIITGLSLTAERRLRENWHVPAGQVFDRVYFEAFVSKLESDRPSIFGDLPIHYEEVGRWLRANAETKTVDVLLDFK